MEIVRRPFTFFLELVEYAFRHQRVSPDPDIEHYLAELLERFSRDKDKLFFQPLRIHLLQTIQESSGVRISEIRDIADTSLFTAGICMPNVKRRILNTRYYIEVSESAYRILFFDARARQSASRVYEKFSQDIKPFVRLLKEIGREYVFKASIEDVVRVCERYMLRGAEEDRQWLLEHGVTILPEFTDNKKRIIV